MKQQTVSILDPCIPIVKRNIPLQDQRDAGVTKIIQPKYAVINIYDIDQQVGLVKCPINQHQFYVIAPYFVFNSNLKNTAGSISLI